MIKIPDQPQSVHNAALILGNTLRLGIIRQLALGKDNRADIAKALNVTEDSLTRQIATLVEHGLVTSHIVAGPGRPVRFEFHKDKVQELHKLLGEYIDGSIMPIDNEQPLPEVDGRAYRKRSK